MAELFPEEKPFWAEAFTWRGAASARVLPTAFGFGAFATFIYLLYTFAYPGLVIEVGPHEIAGVLLSLLLVFRTNGGYERWWEARKLWGGIVNQSRNLVLIALAHGPADGRWREQIVRWTAAFPYVAKGRLRGDRDIPELKSLLGESQAAGVRSAEHMPSYVALRISELLREGCERHGMDRFTFLQAERERCALLDNLGGCERIRNTPLATVYSITIRRFILLFLGTLPFALLHKFEVEWLTPVVTFLLAYPVLTLDLLGIELQQPFCTRSLNHLPLNDICHAIEKNLLALLHEKNGQAYSETGLASEASGVSSVSGSGGACSGPG
ncbi:MAG TPA: bestrophin family ion channel [Gemmataceae bacterium]|jgi:putative membrane protein